MKFTPIWLILMLHVFLQSSAAQSGTSALPDANPGRPTVSTRATLTPVGYLQFENGTLLAEGSTEFSNRFGVSDVTKLAVFPRLELFLQSEPLAISNSEDRIGVDEGEVFAPLCNARIRNSYYNFAIVLIPYPIGDRIHVTYVGSRIF